MDFEQLWKGLHDLSFTCGMNQRYAQYFWTDAMSWSDYIDIAVVFTTMLSLALSVASYFVPPLPLGEPTPLWRRLPEASLIVALFAAMAGMWLLVSPQTENATHYGNMFLAWSELRQDVDSAITDAASMQERDGSELVYLQRRYRDLLAKKNQLNAREPSPDKELLAQFYLEEKMARTAVTSSAPLAQPKAPTSWANVTGLVLAASAFALLGALVMRWWSKRSAPPATATA